MVRQKFIMQWAKLDKLVRKFGNHGFSVVLGVLSKKKL